MLHAQTQLFEDEFPLIRCCSDINEIRIAEEIEDLTIEVKGGISLHAHRIILAARMPSLRAALSGPRGKANSLLRWSTAPLGLATSMLNYAYTGQIEITNENVKGMIMFARMMTMPVLEKWGAEFMINTVSLETLADTWNFARSLNSRSLMGACVQKIKERFESTVFTDLFVGLPADMVLTLLRSEDLPVDSEEHIFGAISRWVCSGEEVSEEKLKIHAPAMLKEIQWQHTSAQFRNHLLQIHPIFKMNHECAYFMIEVEQWIGAADVEKPPCPFNLNGRRMRQPREVFVFGKIKNRERGSVLCFDANLKNGRTVGNMEMRYAASFSVVRESVFVVGGKILQPFFNSACVEEFLVREGCWHRRAPLTVWRRNHAAAVITVDAGYKQNGKKALIGVFGGVPTEEEFLPALSSCELYDVAQNSWYPLPELPETRWGLAAASLPGDNRFFIFGGVHNAFVRASVNFCQLGADWRENVTSDRTTNFWLSAAPMRHARAFLSAAHFRGIIIVAGGRDSQYYVKFVEMFTLPDATCSLGQWTELATMKQPRACFTLLTSVDDIFSLGGDTGTQNVVETFNAPDRFLDFDNDLTSWTWSQKPSLMALEEISGAAIVRI